MHWITRIARLVAPPVTPLTRMTGMSASRPPDPPPERSLRTRLVGSRGQAFARMPQKRSVAKSALPAALPEFHTVTGFADMRHVAWSSRGRAFLPAALAILLLATPALATYRLISGPAADDPMQVRVYQLDNGLTVYLTANPLEPRFHAEIVVRAGSKHDPDDLTGMAHYMEHMLFKGTSRLGTLDYEAEKEHLDRIQDLYDERFVETDPERRAELYRQINDTAQLAARYAIPGELDRLYTSMGERGFNAGTSFEYIMYRVDLPANRLHQWARIEADRFHDPVFRLFQTELETVYEEMNMRVIDNRDALLRNAVNALLYLNHPYGTPIIGTIEDLHNPSISRMYEFYEQHNVPSNMAVLISGDIDMDQAIRVIAEEFAVWQPGTVPEPRQWPEPPIETIRRDTVYYPGQESLLMAFRTEPSTHPDTEALQVLDMILDNAVAGLINLNLNQLQRVRRAGSYTTSHHASNDYGAQYLYGVPKEGQGLEEVEQLLLEQLELVKRGEFDDGLIPAIVNDFKKRNEQNLESNGPRVRFLRDAFIADTDWDTARRHLDRMESVTRSDVIRVANRYFDGPYVVGYRLDGEAEIPPVEKPPLDPIEIDAARQSEFARAILAMPVTPIQPEFVVEGEDYQVATVRDGVTLYYAHNPLNSLFDLSLSVELGTLQENRMAVARELLDKSGSARLDAAALKQEWYRLGTDFRMEVSDQETVLRLSGLDDNFAASVVLLAEWLERPVATQATLDDLIQIVLKNREDAVQDHNSVHRALFSYNRLGDMAYYRRILPNEDLRRLSVDELVELVGGLRGYEQTWSYTGPLSLAQVQEVMHAYYPLPAELQPPPPYQVLPVRSPDTTEIYFVHQDLAQALVRLESGGVRFDPALSPAIQLFGEYFYGGMAGIVFQELREARALAYATWAWYFNAGRQEEYNLLSGFIGTQADKTAEALEAFTDLLDNMPASPERFQAAQTALVNQYRTQRLGFRQVLGAVRTWHRRGLDGDPRAAYYAAIRDADLETLLHFHAEHVGDRPRLVSIVGNRERIDMEDLARQGNLIELDVDEVFNF